MPFVTVVSSDRVIANGDALVITTATGLVHVRDGVMVASTGVGAREGIQVDAADVAVVVAGEVIGSNGVLLNGTGGEVNIVEGGIISGASRAISVTSVATIINNGTLIGGGTTVAATSFLNLVNHGDILGEIGVGTVAGSLLINDGFIAGNLLLGSGNDTVDNRHGLIVGSVVLGAGDDSYDGGAGRDLLSDGLGEDTVDLGGGDDRLLVVNDGASDLLDGGDGRDALAISGTAIAIVNLGRGTVSSVGGASDVISGFEIFVLGTGADVFVGDSAANTVNGGVGNDDLRTSGGNDRALGQGGSDTIFGGDGNDRLFGGADNDAMSGGTGSDILRGGTGFDVMTGSADADLFLFATAAEMQAVGVGAAFDRITDFTPGSDRIDVYSLDANPGGGTADDAFVFRGSAAINGAGQISVRQVAGNTFVDFSFGTATVEATLQLDGLRTLTASDFVL